MSQSDQRKHIRVVDDSEEDEDYKPVEVSPIKRGKKTKDQKQKKQTPRKNLSLEALEELKQDTPLVASMKTRSMRKSEVKEQFANLNLGGDVNMEDESN